MTVDYDRHVDVPQEILQYCDSFTMDAERNDLRYLDCVLMNMGEYGNDPEELKEMRQRIMPVFD
tara:strand:+ start:4489 stop:4680 length:192 start_codon:yes stop_codon:yes gene_type:complete